MITKIEALNYRCLRYVSQPLGPFHILVGPNGSGKSAFLDIISFLSDLFSNNLETAVYKRTTNFHDLVWGREGRQFEIAIEAQPPQAFFDQIELPPYKYRYEIAIGIDDAGELQVLYENGFAIDILEANKIRSNDNDIPSQYIPQTLITNNSSFKVIEGHSKGHIQDRGSNEIMPGRFKPDLKRLDFSKTMLANFQTPTTEWLLDFLMSCIKHIELDVGAIRNPSPPGQGHKLNYNGSNLPWVIKNFKKKHKSRFNEWVEHLGTAINDISEIMTRTREEDKHCYLMVKYKTGLEVPSWCVSEGTLRLLALTLLAYLPEATGIVRFMGQISFSQPYESDPKGIYLIEEPENGVHPLALETIYQSLSSVYDGQVLVATHSPLLVSLAKPEQILCFSKDEDGAAQIISGDKHPMLKDWSQRVDLGTMFASGVLD